jgi:hypothetical protein
MSELTEDMMEEIPNRVLVAMQATSGATIKLLVDLELVKRLSSAEKRIAKLGELLQLAELPDLPTGEETPEELEVMKKGLIIKLSGPAVSVERASPPKLDLSKLAPPEESPRSKKRGGAQKRKDASLYSKKRLVAAKAKSRR